MTDHTDTGEIHEGTPPLEAGKTIAPGYVVIAHLHRSITFDVYDAWSEERDCRCIAKVPLPDLVDDRELRRGLLKEGRLLKKFTHPHIVRAYETITKPSPALILETLTGATLAYLIDASSRRLPLADVAHLGLHLCSAVRYLHRDNILHLDLKPANIVSECRTAKILDLSIARPPGRGTKETGTAQYMAPEQVSGDLLSPATDVWGIGAVLFEATTGEVPFNRDLEDDEEPTVYEQLERRAESVRAYRRVPRAFAQIVGGCLDPDPAQRPTVNALRESLTNFADSLETMQRSNSA